MLTEKGKIALRKVKENYKEGERFTAADLSAKCGEKIVAATLTGVVNNGYLEKFDTKPVEYSLIEGLGEIILDAVETKKGCNKENLAKAKQVKNDEFYTRREDISSEVIQYKKQLIGKTIYLPCDDPVEKKSQFWDFFVDNFDMLGLKKVIATHYDENGGAYKIWVEDDQNGDGYIDDSDAQQEDLIGNGDFRSEECIQILKESDIVITNPPFSLFREFISWIMKENKEFLVIGNKNAFTYKEIFPLIKENKLWTGYNIPKDFILPDGSTTKSVNGLCRWFTNLKTKKRTEQMTLTASYYDDKNKREEYPKYDNYDAINVNKVVNIPNDYFDVMGVPITFIGSYCPEQFEIIGLGNSRENFTPTKNYINPIKHLKNGNEMNGEAINHVLTMAQEECPIDKIYYTSDNSKYLVPPYARILIRRKQYNFD